ncbi:unnamed protein product, partial [Amoebophrya sp. A120]
PDASTVRGLQEGLDRAVPFMDRLRTGQEVEINVSDEGVVSADLRGSGLPEGRNLLALESDENTIGGINDHYGSSTSLHGNPASSGSTFGKMDFASAALDKNSTVAADAGATAASKDQLHSTSQINQSAAASKSGAPSAATSFWKKLTGGGGSTSSSSSAAVPAANGSTKTSAGAPAGTSTFSQVEDHSTTTAKMNNIKAKSSLFMEIKREQVKNLEDVDNVNSLNSSPPPHKPNISTPDQHVGPNEKKIVVVQQGMVPEKWSGAVSGWLHQHGISLGAADNSAAVPASSYDFDLTTSAGAGAGAPSSPPGDHVLEGLVSSSSPGLGVQKADGLLAAEHQADSAVGINSSNSSSGVGMLMHAGGNDVVMPAVSTSTPAGGENFHEHAAAPEPGPPTAVEQMQPNAAGVAPFSRPDDVAASSSVQPAEEIGGGSGAELVSSSSVTTSAAHKSGTTTSSFSSSSSTSFYSPLTTSLEDESKTVMRNSEATLAGILQKSGNAYASAGSAFGGQQDHLQHAMPTPGGGELPSPAAGLFNSTTGAGGSSHQEAGQLQEQVSSTLSGTTAMLKGTAPSGGPPEHSEALAASEIVGNIKEGGDQQQQASPGEIETSSNPIIDNAKLMDLLRQGDADYQNDLKSGALLRQDIDLEQNDILQAFALTNAGDDAQANADLVRAYLSEPKIGENGLPANDGLTEKSGHLLD